MKCAPECTQGPRPVGSRPWLGVWLRLSVSVAKGGSGPCGVKGERGEAGL